MEHEIDYSFSKPYITSGEHVLWRGTPEKGNILTKNDFFLIPFSLIWSSVVAYAAHSTFTSDSPIFAKLFMIPFFCGGAYLLAGRFIALAWKRSHSAYVLTNRKVIRKCGNRIDTMELAGSAATHLEMYRNGCGTITFGDPSMNFRRNSRTNISGQSELFALENIQDPARVQGLIISHRNPL